MSVYTRKKCLSPEKDRSTTMEVVGPYFKKLKTTGSCGECR